MPARDAYHSAVKHALEGDGWILYRSLLRTIEPARRLILAVPQIVYDTTFAEPIARPALDELQLNLLTFDPAKECIVKWIPSNAIGH